MHPMKLRAPVTTPAMTAADEMDAVLAMELMAEVAIDLLGPLVMFFILVPLSYPDI